jgi:hypothetical protein
MIRIALAVALLTGTASAHEWYPARCCGGEDCAALPPSAVEWTPLGWHILETDEFIPEERAHQSPDQQFHRCRRDPSDPKSKTRSGCFWAPGLGM